MTIRILPLSFALPLILAGCAGVPLPWKKDAPAPVVQTAPAPAPRPPAAARTAAQFDTTTAEERRAAATPAPAAERRLGETVASLGNPAEAGFWLRTPLVTSERQGRVVHPGTGASAAVTLIPNGGAAGAGSQLSLPAFRLLGLPLTDLPTLTVYAR